MSETSIPTDAQRAVAAVIVLAAGAGTRMKSKRSKLLHELAGHSMLSYAVNAATALEPQHLVVVVGHLREQVTTHLQEIAPHCRTAIQDQPNGTGHAVECGLADLDQLAGEVVVTYGDVPMLTGDTLAELVTAHRANGDAITVLTARLPDPSGYGRIVRDSEGLVARVVEHKDADDAVRSIDEVNSGIYVFEADVLRAGLSRITTDNAQGELYLTDVLAIARGDGLRVGAYPTGDLWQTEGVNDRVQLANMNREMNRRICADWMRAGVTILDPATTWIHSSVDLSADVTVLPNTFLEGATSVGPGATIGPDTTLTDVEVGAEATITRSQVSLAVIGPGATVGPFAYVRPGTQLGARGKIGTFVETKNTRIGEGAKVPHLTYAGDAFIDAGANIGAGTIFANYDGENKFHSHVGKGAFVGSNAVLVAPVDIGDGGYVAAGSTVTEDVPPGTLAVARGRQKNADGWVARRKPGSKADRAASESGDYHPHDEVTADRADRADRAGRAGAAEAGQQ